MVDPAGKPLDAIDPVVTPHLTTPDDPPKPGQAGPDIPAKTKAPGDAGNQMVPDPVDQESDPQSDPQTNPQDDSGSSERPVDPQDESGQSSQSSEPQEAPKQPLSDPSVGGADDERSEQTPSDPIDNTSAAIDALQPQSGQESGNAPGHPDGSDNSVPQADSEQSSQNHPDDPAGDSDASRPKIESERLSNNPTPNTAAILDALRPQTGSKQDDPDRGPNPSNPQGNSEQTPNKLSNGKASDTTSEQSGAVNNGSPEAPARHASQDSRQETPPNGGADLGGLIMDGLGSGPTSDQSSPAQRQPNDVADNKSGQRPPITVGGQVFTPANAGLEVAGQTIIPGAAPITVAGAQIAIDPSGVLDVGGTKSTLTPAFIPTAANERPAAPQQEAYKALEGGVEISGQRVAPGAAPVTIAGQQFSLDSASVLNVGGSKVNLVAEPSGTINIYPKSSASSGAFAGKQTFTVADQTFEAEPSGFAIAGSTLTPGGVGISVAGTPVSLGQSGNLQIGASTVQLTNNAPTNVITVADQTLEANPTGFAIGGATLNPNGPPITIAGTPVSLGQSGVLSIGTSTTQLSNSAHTDTITVNGQTFEVNPTGFIIEGSTVTPNGSPITVAGTPISLGSSGILQIGSSTTQLSPQPTGQAGTITTIGGIPLTITTISASGSSPVTAIIADGTTVTEGESAATIRGSSVRLGPSGSLFVGNTTAALPTGPALPGSFEGKGARRGQERGLWFSILLFAPWLLMHI